MTSVTQVIWSVLGNIKKGMQLSQFLNISQCKAALGIEGCKIWQYDDYEQEPKSSC
jgi:hypothetical protein